MSKPLSRPNEIGRAVGYKIDADLLLERLTQAALDSPANSEHDKVLLKELERGTALHRSNAAQKPLKRLWVVVKIERGVPVMIDAYRDKRSANKRAEFLLRHMALDVDSVELFAVKLDEIINLKSKIGP